MGGRSLASSLASQPPSNRLGNKAGSQVVSRVASHLGSHLGSQFGGQLGRVLNRTSRRFLHCQPYLGGRFLRNSFPFAFKYFCFFDSSCFSWPRAFSASMIALRGFSIVDAPPPDSVSRSIDFFCLDDLASWVFDCLYLDVSITSTLIVFLDRDDD